jgi:hypothetical protein
VRRLHWWVQQLWQEAYYIFGDIYMLQYVIHLLHHKNNHQPNNTLLGIFLLATNMPHLELSGTCIQLFCNYTYIHPYSTIEFLVCGQGYLDYVLNHQNNPTLDFMRANKMVS